MRSYCAANEFVWQLSRRCLRVLAARSSLSEFLLDSCLQSTSD